METIESIINYEFKLLFLSVCLSFSFYLSLFLSTYLYPSFSSLPK